ncbi:MAG: PAS domain-containing protein [Candidatus Jettenia sp. CY-1]|nr:MAG: PAS domain-containing protein [Candidatus Jettenia sp. CY-1]
MSYFEEDHRSFYKRYEHISRYAYDCRVESDDTLVYECVTESFTHITGYTLKEVNIRGGWLSLIHPDDIHIFMKHLDNLFSGQSHISEFRIIAKNGESRWLRDFAQPIWEKEQGRVIRIYGTIQDITSQNQSDETLRDPASVYHKSLFRNASIAFR